MPFRIPWAKPDFWGRERTYVAEALESGWISGGAFVDRIERDVGVFCDVPHALAVANGTMALHLAYLAVGLQPRDEVVVPGFAFQAAANVALHMGARPVFAEVDRATWCITADAIERVLTPRTRVVVPVHTYGNACDMDRISALCRQRGVTMIEDAAESFGTRYKGVKTGTIGDLGCLSFQATKTITTGEGGMVLTRRGELVERMKLFRSHGMLRTRYLHEVAGLNFRLANTQAAIGCAQLEQIDAIIQARQRLVTSYTRHLSTIDGVELQVFSAEVDPVVWAVAVRLDPRAFPQGRDAVMGQLGEAGIETRPGFYPASSMKHLYSGTIDIPVCEDVALNVISPPSFPSLTAEQIEFVCASLRGLRH